MPGALELKTIGDLDLELVESSAGVGASAPVQAKNTGTTSLSGVVVEVLGDGADHVQLSIDRRSWSDKIKLGPLEKGKSATFYTRAVYGPDDAEDRLDFKLVATALSIG